MKKITLLLIFIFSFISITAQLPVELNSSIKERLATIAATGNVKIKKENAFSTFSQSMIVLEKEIYTYTKEQLVFSQQVEFPRSGSYLNIELPGILSPAGIELLDNGLNYSTTEPELHIQTLYTKGKVYSLINGEYISAGDNESSEERRYTLDKHGDIKADPGNRVDSMEVLYKYIYTTEAEVITLSPDKPLYQRDDESIRLTRMEGNKVEIKVNYPAFQRIVRIEGKNSKNKRMLSDLTWTSGYLMKDLVKIYIELESTEWVQELKREKPHNDEYTGYPMEAGFLLPPTEINLFLSTRTDSITGNVMVYPKEEEVHKVGVFIQSDKAGVINNNGNVIIAPSFIKLQYMGGIIFYGKRHEEDVTELYKLDIAHKALIPVGYKYYPHSSNSNYCDGTITVYERREEPDGNSYLKYGVMDYEGNMIIPVIYDRVATCVGLSSFIIVRQYKEGSRYESLDGLYNSRGEQLLPVAYEKLECSDYYIKAYAKEEDTCPELYHYDWETEQISLAEIVEFEIIAPETE